MTGRAGIAHAARLRRAREFFAAFVEVCGRDERGQPLRLDWIHLSWIFHVDYAWGHGKHALIMAPFGSGKTSAFAVPLCAWLVGCNPQVRIKIVCNADDHAKQRVAAARSMIEAAAYASTFPEVRRGVRRWSDHELYVERQGHSVDPTVHARGVLTKGIGGRADFLIFDDVCDQLNSAEPGARTKVKDFSRGTWMSRLDGADARALMIATPWHPGDATHDFWNDPDWCTLRQPVARDKLRYEQEVYNAGDDYADLQAGFLLACRPEYQEEIDRAAGARRRFGLV